MKGATAKMLSKACTDEEVFKWARNLTKFTTEAHPIVFALTKKVCEECPFRNGKARCIGEDCPIHMLKNTINLMPKRGGLAVKKILLSKK